MRGEDYLAVTQVYETWARTAGTIISVRGEGPGWDGTVHAARLIDLGNGDVQPILPVCEALIVPVPADEPTTCEICLIRLRPDSLTKAARHLRGLLRRFFPPSP